MNRTVDSEADRMDRRKLGEIGENMAADLLEAKGYRILERNYRCRAGEIDIIAERWDEVCFIEVKTRQGFDFGRPCESVTVEKKRHIRNVARHYLEEQKAQGAYPHRVDFQIIEIIAEHHINAF